MKKIFILLLSILALCSCQDDKLTDFEDKEISSTSEEIEDTPFLTFSSKQELNEAIDLIKEGFSPEVARIRGTRAISASPKQMSFESLLEANKRRCFASLTPAQLDSIKNDKDGLEYCMSDSIIADYEFAQMLNSYREIQVGDSVYRFFENGVAYTDKHNAPKLRCPKVEQDVQNMTTDLINVGPHPIPIDTNMYFIPHNYKAEEAPLYVDNRDPIQLKNGIVIPKEDIRDVDFDSKGDGGWIHYAWGRIWGKNILAIKKFRRHYRMRLGVYDQSYIVYANIGVEMKMQKKRCGLWWNCKAQEIRLGWTAVELSHSMPKTFKSIIYPDMAPKEILKQPYPDLIKRKNYPFTNEERILFHVPIADYDFTVKDANKLFMSGIKYLAENGNQFIRGKVRNPGSNGIYAVDEKMVYIVTGPDEVSKSNARTFEKVFLSRFLIKEFEFNFGYGGFFKLNSIKIKLDDIKTKLGRCSIYGAVKFDDQWLGARITKKDL